MRLRRGIEHFWSIRALVKPSTSIPFQARCNFCGVLQRHRIPDLSHSIRSLQAQAAVTGEASGRATKTPKPVTLWYPSTPHRWGGPSTRRDQNCSTGLNLHPPMLEGRSRTTGRKLPPATERCARLGIGSCAGRSERWDAVGCTVGKISVHSPSKQNLKSLAFHPTPTNAH